VIVNRAEADRQARLSRASGEAEAFTDLVDARAPFTALTDHRLYWEAVASVLAARSKFVLDADQSSRHRHLIVPNLPIPPVDVAPILRPAAGAASDRGQMP
jgi:regulator of protease activity HflC (stomatin/prohibitin superfamily)